MVNVIVCGACGRMGSAIINMAKQDKDFNIVAGTEIDGSPSIGNKNPLIVKSLISPSFFENSFCLTNNLTCLKVCFINKSDLHLKYYNV